MYSKRENELDKINQEKKNEKFKSQKKIIILKKIM